MYRVSPTRGEEGAKVVDHPVDSSGREGKNMSLNSTAIELLKIIIFFLKINSNDLKYFSNLLIKFFWKDWKMNCYSLLSLQLYLLVHEFPLLLYDLPDNDSTWSDWLYE